MRQTKLLLLTSPDWTDYELLDSGHLQKFESLADFGSSGPNHKPCGNRALIWQSGRPMGVFVAGKNSDDDTDQGRWQLAPNLPDMWEMGYQSLRFLARPTPFRHLGFSGTGRPLGLVCDRHHRFIAGHKRPPLVLNLFAYSGLASLHAAALVPGHTSRRQQKSDCPSIRNRDMSGMSDAPIRFITDDATGFVG